MDTSAQKPIRSEKELLADCRRYVETAHWVTETEYEDPSSENFMDVRLLDALNSAAALIGEIDYVLCTKH